MDTTYRTYSYTELDQPGFNLNSVILLSDTFVEWRAWDSKIHAYPVRRDLVMPFYQAPYYRTELDKLKSLGSIVVWNANKCEYVDFLTLVTSTPDLRIVERPERFDSNESYNDWLNWCGMPNVTRHMGLTGRFTKEAFVRASLNFCEYKGGYCHIAYSDPHTKLMPNHYFVLYSDYDDGSYNIYTENQQQAEEIWNYIYNIPDLDHKDVHELGMG